MTSVNHHAEPTLSDSSHLEATDLLKKLSIDSQTNTHQVSDSINKPSKVKEPVQSSTTTTAMTPQVAEYIDPTMCYYTTSGYASPGYYYGGYDGSTNDWNDPSKYGAYGDNSALLYHGYGYQPYGPYSPASSVPTMGPDGQLYGPQHQYQYPNFYQSPTTPSGTYTPSQAAASTKGEGPKSVHVYQASVPAEVANENAKESVSGNLTVSIPPKTSSSYTSVNSNGSSVKGFSRGAVSNTAIKHSNHNGTRSNASWVGGSGFTEYQHRPVASGSLSSAYSLQTGKSHNPQQVPKFMGLQNPRQSSGMHPNVGYMNKVYPNNRFYNQYGNTTRPGLFASNGYDYRTNGREWFSVDRKYTPKGRGYGFLGHSNENLDGFNELSRGPRSRGHKNQMGDAPITLALRGENVSPNINKQGESNSTVVPDREQYNREEFPVSYSEAKFFIIKSYSEDDVHKSIKYNVWASTPNGNKKLDAAYHEAQAKTGGCPVFLFFSVNTSGQFVGVAEMAGPIDFNKTLEYWQQDKWNGCFPVKWHIVKDVPNSLLKHITLENNDNKPVTNSRDTQEVKLNQGLQMLKIFKEYATKACILDDFAFYESRQKIVQERKAKQQLLTRKQVLESDGSLHEEKQKGVTEGQLESYNSLDDEARGNKVNEEHKA